MESILANVVILAMVVTPFTTALTQGVKLTFPDLDKRWLPSVSVLVGVIVAVAIGMGIAKSEDLVTYIAVGVVSGLAASGLYDFTTTKRSLVSEPIKENHSVEIDGQ